MTGAVWGRQPASRHRPLRRPVHGGPAGKMPDAPPAVPDALRCVAANRSCRPQARRPALRPDARGGSRAGRRVRAGPPTHGANLYEQPKLRGAIQMKFPAGVCGASRRVAAAQPGATTSATTSAAAVRAFRTRSAPRRCRETRRGAPDSLPGVRVAHRLRRGRWYRPPCPAAVSTTRRSCPHRSDRSRADPPVA